MKIILNISLGNNQLKEKDGEFIEFPVFFIGR